MSRGTTHDPYDWKCNSRDRKEIALMHKHFDEDLTEAEWMRLCNRVVGLCYDKKGKPK